MPPSLTHDSVQEAPSRRGTGLFSARVGRRAFLRGAAAGAGVLAVGIGFGAEACSSSTKAAQHTPTGTPPASPTPAPYPAFHTRPDLAGAPSAQVIASHGSTADTYIFLTPNDGSHASAALFNSQGKLVWIHPASQQATNFQVVRYRGQDMLAWFEGAVAKTGYGTGEHVLCNDRYEEVARIAGSGGAQLDLHELVVTPQGTALVEAYTPVTMDLTPYGGLADTPVLDCTIEEIDIESGAQLFSWSSLDHVGLGESRATVPTAAGSMYDYFHINAIEVDRDGNLLVSARNTCALYKIDRTTGDIVWRFGGADGASLPAPHITMKDAAESFWYQHDVRRNPDGTISIFDDGGSPYKHSGRGLVMQVDEGSGKATVRQSVGGENSLHVSFQGSFRRQADGHWLVGWGDIGRVTEYSQDGKALLDIAFTGNSYRALRFPWRGNPQDLPLVAAQAASGGTTVWASWNGATDVAQWRVLGGDDASSLMAYGTYPWRDFETAMPLRRTAKLFTAEALDAHGAVLARATPVARQT
jgi:outer membrane protein assembly factor BamB